VWITGHDVFGMRRNGTGNKFAIFRVIFYPIPFLWGIYEKGIQTFLKRSDEPSSSVLREVDGISVGLNKPKTKICVRAKHFLRKDLLVYFLEWHPKLLDFQISLLLL